MPGVNPHTKCIDLPYPLKHQKGLAQNQTLPYLYYILFFCKTSKSKSRRTSVCCNNTAGLNPLNLLETTFRGRLLSRFSYFIG